MRRLLCSIFAVLFSTWAHAHVPPTALADATDLYAKFDELLRQRQAEGKLPTLKRPKDRDLLRKIWDHEALIGTPPYDASDQDTLFFIMAKSGTLAKPYVQGGPSLHDEATHSMAFLIRVVGASQPAFADYLAHQHNVAELLRGSGAKARGGVEKMLRGAAISLSDPALEDKNKILLVEALRTSGPYLAQSVSLDRRQAMTDLFVPLVGQLPVPAQKSLKTFMQGIKTADCNLFCADGK